MVKFIEGLVAGGAGTLIFYGVNAAASGAGETSGEFTTNLGKVVGRGFSNPGVGGLEAVTAGFVTGATVMGASPKWTIPTAYSVLGAKALVQLGQGAEPNQVCQYFAAALIITPVLYGVAKALDKGIEGIKGIWNKKVEETSTE